MEEDVSFVNRPLGPLCAALCDAGEGRRARALAPQALSLQRAPDQPDADELHEIEQWLREHGGE